MFIPRWVLAIVIFIEKLIEIFHKPECLLTWANVQAAQSVLKDGDVLLSRTDWELSNYLIPGPYKHAAVYFGGDVYEAVTAGVRKVPFAEWVLKKDHCGVARIKAKFSDLASGKDFLDAQIGDPYDYNFLDVKSSRAWFCSLYVYKFLCAASVDFAQVFTLRATFGEQTVTPDDFWQAADKLDRILAQN